jgi:hypothetical protein
VSNCKINQIKKNTEQIMVTSRLIDFDGIDINQHEHMKNELYNLNNHHYLFYNHKCKMINEYNNPSLI